VSVLTGPEIRRLVEGVVGPNGERIVIDPFDPACVGPASYDIHLGDEMRVYDTDQTVEIPLPPRLDYVSKTYASTDPIRYSQQNPIDPLRPPKTLECELKTPGTGEHWLLEPGRVYLAATREYTETHRLAAQVAGRSSIGRLGLFVHVTAGFIDPGFRGRLTLELVATQPVIVRPGMRIGQIVYQTLSGEYQEYSGRYQNDDGTVASRYHLPDGGAGREGK